MLAAFSLCPSATRMIASTGTLPLLLMHTLVLFQDLLDPTQIGVNLRLLREFAPLISRRTGMLK